MMRIYLRPVVEGIISSRTIRVDGHSYVRYLDKDISSEMVTSRAGECDPSHSTTKCNRFYRSYNPGNNPKIITCLIEFIDVYNEQNPDSPLDCRITFESEDYHHNMSIDHMIAHRSHRCMFRSSTRSIFWSRRFSVTRKRMIMLPVHITVIVRWKRIRQLRVEH